MIGPVLPYLYLLGGSLIVSVVLVIWMRKP